MYGMIKPVYNKMNKEQKAIFKSYYCGLCSSLGEFSGWIAQIGLSYEMTFLYMILGSMEEESFVKCSCPMNPFCKKMCIKQKLLSEFFAEASILLMYEKCKDNLRDNDKVFVSKLIVSQLSKSYNRICEANRVDSDSLKDGLSFFYKLEERNDITISQLADEFGRVFGNLLKSVPKAEDAELMYKLGYWLGRWVYVADATVDIFDDYKRKRFNPFLIRNERDVIKIREENDALITKELFDAHDCVIDIIKLLNTNEDVIKMVDDSMSVAEGQIFNYKKGKRYARK